MRINNQEELERIAGIICESLHVQLERVKGRSRKREISTARQLIMYYGYNTALCTYKFIGAFLGNRDHSTVGHGISTVEDLVISDFKFRSMAKTIEAKINRTELKHNNELKYNFETFKQSQNEA